MKIWLWPSIAITTFALLGCDFGERAEDEVQHRLEIPFDVQSGAEAKAEYLLNDFSDDLDDGNYAAACQKMTPLLQLRFAVPSGERRGGCEKNMRTVGEAGSLGDMEIDGTRETKRGLWVNAGEAEFLIRQGRIANIRQP